MRALGLAVLLFGSFAGATTYYVDKNGSDSYTCQQCQNPLTPKQSIRAAMACAGSWGVLGSGAGDTVVVGNGTYPEEIFWNDWPTGTPGNPFTLKAANRGTCGDVFGGCNVKLRPTTGACNGLPCQTMEIGDLGVNLHVVVDGFELDASTNCCPNASGIGGGHSLRPWGNFFTARYMEIKEPMGSSISSSTNDGVFSHIAINGCSRDQAYKNGTGHNVMYMGGSRNVYEYITAAGPNCAHNELTVFNGGGGGPASEDNVFQYVLTNGIGIGIYSGYRNIIRNSVILNNTAAYQESGAGIIVAYGCSDCQVLNNTVYNNSNQCIHINSAGNWGVIVKNNICYQNGNNIINNEMAGGGSAEISNNLMVNPSFVNPTTDLGFKDRTANNFKLQAGSAARNAGANLSGSGVIDDLAGAARPQEGTYDIGAYEYAPGSIARYFPIAPKNSGHIRVRQSGAGLIISGFEKAANARVAIYSPNGSLVASLDNIGEQGVTWNPVGKMAGVYVVKVRSGSSAQTAKLFCGK